MKYFHHEKTQEIAYSDKEVAFRKKIEKTEKTKIFPIQLK